MELRVQFPTPHGLAPTLVHVPDGGRRGTVLLYHGLGADKETQRTEAWSLCRQGFLVVTCDAWGHGERRLEHFDAAVDEGGLGVMLRYTVEEVPSILDGLTRLIGLQRGEVGVAGISMGAFIALGAAAAEPRIDAVVSILGSPDWEVQRSLPGIGDLSPHLHPHSFPPRPLLALNGGLDVNVPPQPMREFVQALRPGYVGCPERLDYIEYPQSEHFMREEDWSDLWQRTIAWFERYLSAR